MASTGIKLTGVYFLDIAKTYFEDFIAGDVFTSRAMTISESQILDFAMMYDPQPIHLDVPGADAGPFGGLIASGFQTLALTFRMFWDLGLMAHCGMGAPGIDDLRWHLPVRPGDTLHTRAQVLAVRESASKSDRGTVTLQYEGFNQKNEKVISFSVNQIMRKRPA